MDLKNKKIAIVHDFLVDFGGAERVLEVLCEMFPEAPIYTLLYDKEKMHGRFKNKEIHASFIQKFPKFLRKRKKWLLPFFPTAPETFDLRDFDIVISSSGAWSKGIVTRLNTIHIAYLHSPMRFVWDANEEYLLQQKRSGIFNFLARVLTNYIRVWDKVAADRPDYLIANSRYTQERIRKYYGRESEVIYPPVCSGLTATNVGVSPLREKHFLIISRLSAYKKIDAVVEAFNKLDLPLVVIGEGEQEKYLRSIAGKNVKILGYKSDKEAAKFYENARAFIFAGVDDFGIAPVEAMAHGVPILAIRKGGVKEIVTSGKTGEFFDAATPEVIADGIRRLIENENSYSVEIIRNRANEFNKQWFIDNLKRFIDKL